ncbi:superinfection immunity protein [Sinomicrobium sp. M5D2P9]
MTLFLQPETPNGKFGVLIFIVLIILGCVFYFLPTIIAILSGKNNAVAIGALNFFLGWTLLGWVVSLVWSLSSESKNQRIIINPQSPAKSEDSFDKLSKLKKLLDENAITREEYESEKRKILGN